MIRVQHGLQTEIDFLYIIVDCYILFSIDTRYHIFTPQIDYIVPSDYTSLSVYSASFELIVIFNYFSILLFVVFPSSSCLFTLYRQVSSVRSVRYDSSDDNSSSIPRRREVGSAKKMKSSAKSKASFSKINCEQASETIDRFANDRRGAETGISWDSLPSSLVKLGKVIKSCKRYFRCNTCMNSE